MEPRNEPARLAVIGDVAGHAAGLQRELRRLGVDIDRAHIPDDLIVVQVGDLVHRGPDSPGVVDLVDKLIAANPGRWVQLAGNHEAQYLFPPRFQWPEQLPAATIGTLRRWWEDGTMRIAAAFDTHGTPVRLAGGTRMVYGAGPLLITHAGLTVGLWQQLGEPDEAVTAAHLLNHARFDDSSPPWRDGMMLGGRTRTDAGVIWAEAASEVHTPWMHAPTQPAFHQAHGHTSPYNHRNSRWWPQAAALTDRATVDPQRRHVRTHTGGAQDMVIWAVDPCHGQTPTKPWQALELQLSTPSWLW